MFLAQKDEVLSGFKLLHGWATPPAGSLPIDEKFILIDAGFQPHHALP